MIQKLQDFADSTYARPHDRIVTEEIEGATIRHRSLRSKRAMFTMACTAFTIGTLLIFISSPFRNDFLAPGPLSSPHAQLLAGDGANRCAACHGAGGESFSAWVVDAFTFGKNIEACQSDLCMKCHKESMDPMFAMNPHNVDPRELAQMTARYKPSDGDLGLVFSPPLTSNNEIACSACHREHHGKVDLTAMTDQQCQSCHTENYHSFETDHPEFANWSQERRQHIAFDHVSHGVKHFPSKGEEMACIQCHVDDAYKTSKLTLPFEQSCARCHNQQLIESGDAGLALFALPMLDLDALKQANISVGFWPEEASGDFDGEIPPVMRLLLHADPVAAKILTKRGIDFSFADLDFTNPEDSVDAGKLVWSIKYLLHDLSVEGVGTIKKRLESVLGRDVDSDHLTQLSANLSQAVFQDTVQRWIPSLGTEVVARRLKQAGVVNPQPIQWLPSTVEINAMRRAMAPDELAVNPLKGLIKPLANTTQPANNPAALPKVTNASPRSGNSPTAAKQPTVANAQPKNAQPRTTQPQAPQPRTNKPKTTRSQVVTNQYGDPSKDPDVLARNPLQGLMQGAQVPVEQAELPVVKTPQDQQVQTQPANNLPVLPNATGTQDTTPQEQILTQAMPQQATSPAQSATNVPITFASGAGWKRDDMLFQISYRPKGHEDALLKSWADLVTQTPNADRHNATQALFQTMTSGTGIGSCRSCHTVDQLSDHSFVMNWKPEYRDPMRRAFTRFSHGPHTMQPGLADCSHCHMLGQELSNKESFMSFNGLNAVSNFAPIVKANCTSCHRKGATDNGCTQCHSYHIGSHVSDSE